MVALKEGLVWLLQRRYGTAAVVDVVLAPGDVVNMSLTDGRAHFAVVVDKVRVHSVDTLARLVAAQVPDAAHIECIVVYRRACTLPASQRNAPIITHISDPDVTVTSFLFSEDEICNHPLQNKIVPQDYRVVDPRSQEHARLAQKCSPLSRLPWMRVDDPVSRILGFRSGDVVAHTDAKGTLPPQTMYRYVTGASALTT